MQMRDLFAPLTPFFFPQSPAVLRGPLAVFLAEHFSPLPLLGEETLLSLAHRWNRGILALRTLCKPFGQAGRDPLGHEELGDSPVDPTRASVLLGWFWGFVCLVLFLIFYLFIFFF